MNIPKQLRDDIVKSLSKDGAKDEDLFFKIKFGNGRFANYNDADFLITSSGQEDSDYINSQVAEALWSAERIKRERKEVGAPHSLYVYCCQGTVNGSWQLLWTATPEQLRQVIEETPKKEKPKEIPTWDIETAIKNHQSMYTNVVEVPDLILGREHR